MKSKLYILCVIAICLLANFKSFSQANTSLSNLTSPTAVNQDLLPNSNNTRNLGSVAKSWKTLYIDSTIYLKDSLFISIKGSQNTFVGQKAGNNLATGNVAGNQIPGSNNAAFGFEALYTNSFGNGNSALGVLALYHCTGGTGNTASGYRSMYYNGHGNYNTATGLEALYQNTQGADNTAIGANALQNNTTGMENTAIGASALYNLTTGYFNTGLGSSVTVSTGNLINATVIGYDAFVDASNKVRVGNTNVTSIGGQVGWTSFSDGRYKKNIKQDVQGLAFINSLQPITYTVDIDGLDAYYDKAKKHDSTYDKMKADMKESADKASKIIYNGFIAQDVEKAAAKLNYNFSGVDKPQSKDGLYGLRYSDFVVPLVKAVQELSKQNDSLKNENSNLEARVAKIEAMMNVSSQSTVISSASLAQNIPNPFANSTSISYNLPQQYASARIIITDKKGVVLKETNLTAKGKGNLNVDASTLAAGAYQYSLIINGKLIDTKQMVLSR